MMDAHRAGSRHSAVSFVFATLIALMLASTGCGWVTPAASRTLPVGPQRVLKVPSQAATVANDGDRIESDPGTYSDCAIRKASRLAIEATGPGVVITGRACAAKELVINAGNEITV